MVGEPIHQTDVISKLIPFKLRFSHCILQIMFSWMFSWHMEIRVNPFELSIELSKFASQDWLFVGPPEISKTGSDLKEKNILHFVKRDFLESRAYRIKGKLSFVASSLAPN